MGPNRFPSTSTMLIASCFVLIPVDGKRLWVENVEWNYLKVVWNGLHTRSVYFQQESRTFLIPRCA